MNFLAFLKVILMVSAMTIVGTHFGRTATIGIDARHGGSFDFGQQNLATGSQFEVMRATILAAGHIIIARSHGQIEGRSRNGSDRPIKIEADRINSHCDSMGIKSIHYIPIALHRGWSEGHAIRRGETVEVFHSHVR